MTTEASTLIEHPVLEEKPLSERRRVMGVHLKELPRQAWYSSRREGKRTRGFILTAKERSEEHKDAKKRHKPLHHYTFRGYAFSCKGTI
ncbi:MAG: hypothetical protein ABIM21_05465 [candidate division WOR-3 bacterium]